VSSRLDALTARRLALQVECAEQRDDVRAVYGGIERSVTRVDRVVEKVRSVGPLVIVGGAALLFALGPGRALRVVRRGLAVALYATQALRFLR
jgi:butyrate kinase